MTLFADELRLSRFNCRMFAKKAAELEGQSLTERNKRKEFINYVQNRIQSLDSNTSGAKLTVVASADFDRIGSLYRIFRVYDEIKGLRSILVSLIDSYHDEGKVSSERAFQLIAFIKNSSACKATSSFLTHIKSCCKEKKITAIQAAQLIDWMERLPNSLLLIISKWHAENKISDEDASQLIALAAETVTPFGSVDATTQEDLSHLSEKEPLNFAGAEFKTKLIELKAARGIPIRPEVIALFSQIVHCIDKMEVYSKKAWFLHFHDQFMECLEQQNAAIQSERLEKWNRHFALQMSTPGSNHATPEDLSSIPKIEQDAYRYWLPRIYEELYKTRDSYSLCIDMLYDDEQLTMNTARQLLDLPREMIDDGQERSFRFIQRLSAIRQPRASCPVRFSDEAFNLILSNYN